MPHHRPRIRILLIDLSGTLHIGSTPTPDAVHALRRLRNAGVPFRLTSNTSKECTADLFSRLRGMGFDVRREELWTSLGALKDEAVKRGLKRYEVLHVSLSTRPYCLLSKSAMQEFPEFEYLGDKPNPHAVTGSEYDSVLVGLAPELLNYDHLTNAFRVLISSSHSSSSSNDGNTLDRHKSPILLATHRAQYVRTPDNLLSLGPGPFVNALEAAMPGDVQMKAEVLGKPTKAFFERVLDSLSTEGDFHASDTNKSGGENQKSSWKGSDIAIIGDDVNNDLGEGAIELGFWRVLVKTGKYREGDELRSVGHSESSTAPDEVQPSFANFVDDLLGESDV